MRTHQLGRDAKRAVLLATFFAVILASVLSAPVVAHAVSVTTPARDVYRHADFSIDVASSDPTGTVLLVVDGRTVEASVTAPGQHFDFKQIALAAGTHEIHAVVRARGITSESARLVVKSWPKPASPVLVTPSRYAAATTPSTVQVGLATTQLSMYLNGSLVNTRAVRDNTLATMGSMTLRAGANTVTLVASNPIGTTTASYTVTRLDYPWPTCIIIDKSDYRLYWIKDGVLVKSYPVAIGKASTPTPSAIWRIDAKYYTDPYGIYGPRKMRLFRQTSSGYVFTAYGIHGTNQPWVIGTMASHGCIRMYNSDILELFPQVPLGTMVQTRP